MILRRGPANLNALITINDIVSQKVVKTHHSNGAGGLIGKLVHVQVVQRSIGLQVFGESIA